LTNTHVHCSTSRHKYYKTCILTHTQPTSISVTVVLNPTLTLPNFQTAAFTIRNTAEVCMRSHQHYRHIIPPMIPLNVSTNGTFPRFWNIVFLLRNVITTTLKL